MKKVYVLGAGFSVQADIPVLAKFFAKVREKKDKTDQYEGSKIEEDTFEKILSLAEVSSNMDNMETAFTHICNETFDIKGFNQGYKDTEQLKKDFLYTVCRTFHLCWTDGGKVSRCLYRGFLEKVIEEQANLITFNYDIILDNLFFDMGLLPYYSFELNEQNTINFTSDYHKLKESGVTFLKMHGSQQWFRCNSCQKEFAKISLNDTWPSHRGNKNYSSGENCVSCCKKTMDYLIIPPLEGKKACPEGTLLKATWKMAERKLREAQEIIFIGYSFPQSDENIRDKFKEWVKNNIVLKSIKVINPDVDNNDFKDRFNKIFLDEYTPQKTPDFPQIPKCSLTYAPKTFLCRFLEDAMKHRQI